MADEDFSQTEGAADPKDFVEKAGAEAAALTGPGGAAEGVKSKEGDPLVDALVPTSPVKALSMFTSFLDGWSSGKNGNSPHQNKTASSHFAGGGGPQRPTPTPLVPETYGQKVRSARNAAAFSTGRRAGATVRAGSIFVKDRLDRLATTSQSLTGGSSTDDKKTPIKGAKVAQAAVEKLSKLTRNINAALHAMEGKNRYDGNEARLEEDAKRQKPLAKATIKASPATMAPPRSASSSSAA